MIVLQLVLFCALFALMVKLAVRNNALNALYFYPETLYGLRELFSVKGS